MNMFGALGRVLADWSAREPSASLLMFVTAILLFSAVFIRSRGRQDSAGRAGAFPAALVAALAFVGAIGAFYFLLDSSFKTFQPAAERLAKGEDWLEEIRNTQKTWGGDIVQEELIVNHTRSYEIVEEVPGPDDSTLYRNKIVIEAVEQDSLAAFSGKVSIRYINARLGTFIANARYEYEVVNQSDYQTQAHFRFPLNARRLYQMVAVTVDGREIKFADDMTTSLLEWDIAMSPHETVNVVIVYSVRGMGSFAYTISTARNIKKFSLEIWVNTPGIYVTTMPTSTAIVHENERAGGGAHLTWAINQAIMTTRLGIQFYSGPITDPSQEGAILLLRDTPRGLMLFATVLVLTLIVCGIPVDLKKFVLLLGLFSTPFLAVMGFDLLRINYLIPLFLASLMVFLVFFRLYRGLARFPLILVSILLLLFMVGYPFAGFLETVPQRNSFDTAVQAGILLYVFGLALYTRVRKAIAR